MLSITSSPGYSSGLANGTPSAEAPTATTAIADDGSADAPDSPAYQISLSAEAELSISIKQTTEISISQTSGGASKSGAAPQDARNARALSTLEAVAESQREWIAKLKAEAQGKDPDKAKTADASATKTKTKSSADAGASSELQITIQQDTEVDVSVSASAQVDVQA